MACIHDGVSKAYCMFQNFSSPSCRGTIIEFLGWTYGGEGGAGGGSDGEVCGTSLAAAAGVAGTGVAPLAFTGSITVQQEQIYQ